MACIFDKVFDKTDGFLIGKTSLYNVKDKTEFQYHMRDAAELVSEIYNDNSPMEKHMLTYLSLATAALIGMNAEIPVEHALSAAGLVALSDIAYHAITAGGDESFAGNGISPANP